MKASPPSEKKPVLRALLVGATGVFGQRLATQLIQESGIKVILAARNLQRLNNLNEKLGGVCEIQTLNRNQVNPDYLKKLQCDVVIDAAGPFQQSQTELIEASITAGCHYIDLADGRKFVANIKTFHQAALEQQVAVISGASSTPALSHAVIDRLTHGWHRIDTIKVAISPGNRAPRGLSVVKAILSYAGKPVRVFRGGIWTKTPGWGLTHMETFPGLGQRLLSVCETPDQDLLVTRYKPTTSAEFYAGVELKVLHLSLVGLAWLARLKMIRSLVRLAKPLLWLAKCFLPLGSDKGGMLVQVNGIDQHDDAIKSQWSLLAEAGNGPYVPTFAALALIRKLRDQSLMICGAIPCVGLLSLNDFSDSFQYFSMHTKTTNLQ